MSGQHRSISPGSPAVFQNGTSIRSDSGASAVVTQVMSPARERARRTHSTSAPPGGELPEALEAGLREVGIAEQETLIMVSRSMPSAQRRA